MFYVYVIFRLNGVPCYVGKGMGGRWKDHVTNARNPHLRNIYLQAGVHLPIIKVRENLSEAAAFATEMALIAAIGRKKDGGPLVNLTDGGDGPTGFVPTALARRVAAELSKARWADPVKREKLMAAHKAAKATEEFSAKRSAISKAMMADGNLRKRISATATLRFADASERARTSEATKNAMALDDVRARVSAGQKERFTRPEELKKLSDRFLGCKLTEEHKAKIGAAHTGQKRSLEARANMSAWQIGRKMSDEAKAKMSAAAKARAAKPGEHERLVAAAKLGALRRWS